MPNEDDSEFEDNYFWERSGGSSGSSHATTVGKKFYGHTQSMAPDIWMVNCWNANNWLQGGFLNSHLGSNTPPRVQRAGNNQSLESLLGWRPWKRRRKSRCPPPPRLGHWRTTQMSLWCVSDSITEAPQNNCSHGPTTSSPLVAATATMPSIRQHLASTDRTATPATLLVHCSRPVKAAALCPLLPPCSWNSPTSKRLTCLPRSSRPS